MHRHEDSLKLLVKEGANPFDRDEEGRNAIDLHRQMYMRQSGIENMDEQLPLRHRFRMLRMSCLLRFARGIFKCCSCSFSCCMRKRRETIPSFSDISDSVDTEGGVRH